MRAPARCALLGLVGPLSGIARAEEPPAGWLAAWDAVLVQALDGDHVQARNDLLQLATVDLDGLDTTLPFVQYWLGQTSWLLADPAGAREALDACIRAGVDKARCLDLRSQIDLETDAVHTVPTTWTFNDAHHGFLHPRAFWDLGSIRILTDGGSVLAWSTEVDGTREDRLVVGFRDPAPPPSQVEITLTSVELDAALMLVFEDVDGVPYMPSNRSFSAPAGRKVTLRVNLADLISNEGRRLDISRLHRMRLLDATALTGITGRNEFRIDEFTVR